VFPVKTRNPPRWYTEYRRDIRCHAVVKDGFTDSTHWNKIKALERIKVLEEMEALEESEQTEG